VWSVLGLGFAGFAILEYHREAAALLVSLSLVALLAGVTVTDPEIVYRGMGVLFAAAMALLARRMKP
ncbi:MAG: hypothetical protein ACLFWM_11365, partial [Actinomycetota bacterium]